MSVLSRIMPARAEAMPVKVLADLDQLVPEPFGFRLGGKVYQIHVGTIRKLAQLSDRLDEIMVLLERKQKGESVTEADLHRAYHKYLSVLCPEMTFPVVQAMTQPQLRRLLAEIHRYATGQNMGYGSTSEPEEKKKIAT